MGNSWDRDDSFIKGYKGDDASGWPIGAKITSDTDGSKERLHVDARISGGTIGAVPTIDKRLRYDDFNVANGGVARNTSIGTTFTRVYNYSGSGLFFGFLLTLEDVTNGWFMRFVVDGQEIFGSSGISFADLYSDQIYNYKENSNYYIKHMGIMMFSSSTFRWEAPCDFPIGFESSIAVWIRKTGGNKFFRAGLSSLVKVS